MKIVVCQRFCPEYMVPLFQRLHRAHDIEFVFSLFGQEHAFFFDPDRLAGLRVRALRPPAFPLLPFRSRMLNKLAFWAHIVVLSGRLAAVLARGRYDVIVGGDFGRFECVVAFLMSRLLRRPFLLWSDAWHWPVTRRDRARVPLVRSMIRGSVALIAGGTKAAEKLVELGGAGRPIVNVFHTNVTARPPGVRAPATRPFVLYVGRLDERKGVEYLIRAFAAVRRSARDARTRDLRLTIVGRGARLDALRALARETGVADSVEFAGWVEHEALDAYYGACAVFVLPSIFTADGGYEPFSNVLLEAMACGAPVVGTTANGASFDVLEDGVNGLVVPDRDAAALAAALGRLLADPAAAEAMGRRGRETIATRFNVDRMAERFGEALRHAARAVRV